MTQPESCPQLLRRTWSDVTFGVERLVALDWNVKLYSGIIHGECANSVWRALPLLPSPFLWRSAFSSTPLTALNHTQLLCFWNPGTLLQWALPLPSPFKISQAVPYLSHSTGDNSEHLSATLAADTIFIIVVLWIRVQHNQSWIKFY